MDEQTLEPCPFCGSADVYRHTADEEIIAGVAMGCSDCGALGPFKDRDDFKRDTELWAAVETAWNLRAAHSVIAGKVAERREVDDLCAKVEADAVSGLRYIEARYGRLEGVGWDRVFDAHDELFRKAAALAPYPERR